MNMPTTFTTFALLSLSHGASALQVDPSQMLMQLSSVLNEVFTPIESTASSLASYVKAGPQPMVTPSPAEAGMVPGTPKGDLATAMWTAYNDVNTNGLWMSYNDSGSIGYWNHNGDWNGHSGDRETWHMYRAPGTDSGCPAITTGSCSTTQLGGTAPPTSCAAVPTSCQSLYSVDARGEITTIDKHRFYDPKIRGWWLEHLKYPLGQPYWLDLFGTLGYQSSDASVPLLVGYYAVPVLDASRTTLMAIALIQLEYRSLAAALAAFNLPGTVVYIMEANDGELVATSNGEAIFNATNGKQKFATGAATELIATSAARLQSIRAEAQGTYRLGNSGISITVADYKRASGSLHHKIVIASYVNGPPTTANDTGSETGTGADKNVVVAGHDAGAAFMIFAVAVLIFVAAVVLAIVALNAKAAAPATLASADSAHKA